MSAFSIVKDGMGNIYVESDHLPIIEKLVDYYQSIGYSCFIRPYLAFLQYHGYKTWCNWELFLRNCKVIFEKACYFLPLEDSNHDPRHIERLMKLLTQIMSRQYDDVLENIDIEGLVYLASPGLLSEDEKTFHECYGFLIELFVHPTTSVDEILIRFAKRGQRHTRLLHVCTIATCTGLLKIVLTSF
ncbi:hypothetical protein RF11_00467 [Thelohanellus kitauei]|uniref:Uncharacterized protein n=1 Tax=Thelohanellus kitauei TaxID=669202 RepID=A0A0C2MZT6_THEKT|nr:hypothetical protein RF11_00467 [Thelohanellus kitauei]